MKPPCLGVGGAQAAARTQAAGARPSVPGSAVESPTWPMRPRIIVLSPDMSASWRLQASLMASQGRSA
jgi:hypothetical protein